MNRKWIYALVTVLVIQEVRFQGLRRKVLDTVIVMQEFLDAQDQDYVDDTFEEIVEEHLQDVDDLDDTHDDDI